MSNQLGAYVVALVLGAIGGAAVFLLLQSGVGPRPLRIASGPVPATIQLTQVGATCRAATIPHRIPASSGDRVTWSVTGQCEGIDSNQVELRFLGECQADGSKRAGTVPDDLFNESPPHRGRNIMRTVKHKGAGCFAYAVVHGTTTLEDPEFEIVY